MIRVIGTPQSLFNSTFKISALIAVDSRGFVATLLLIENPRFPRLL